MTGKYSCHSTWQEVQTGMNQIKRLAKCYKKSNPAIVGFIKTLNIL